MTAVMEVERLLSEARFGDREALDAVAPLVYDELRFLARRQLDRFRPGETLNTTALVHETYLRLADQRRAPFHDRKHLFVVAAMAMRHIIIDSVRRRAAAKRGGGVRHVRLDELGDGLPSVETEAAALLALDDALTRLSGLDERLAHVVQLRFFGGLSVEEAAQALEVSTATIKRDTRVARAFLAREISRSASVMED